MDDKLRNLIAPSSEVRTKRLETFKQYACYGIVAMICIITVFVVPIVAGGLNAENWNYWIPETAMGWFCWWAMKIGTVIGNLAIFGLFKAQGKTNAKDNPNYIKARELLNTQNGKKGFIPKSPTKYQAKTWGTKGVSTLIITAAECLVIGTLIANWDWPTFISCIVSAITAVIFGIVQMIKDEVYWTEEYLLYAEYITKKEQVPVEPEKEKTECLNLETQNSETCKSK